MARLVHYLDRSAAEHQAAFHHLGDQGFRMISVDVHRVDEDEPRYAACWSDRPGPRWWGSHGLDAAGFDAHYKEMANEGRTLVMVSVTGIHDLVFAGIFEEGHDGEFWFDLTGGDGGSFKKRDDDARASGRRLTSLARYGPADAPRFAATWLGDPVRTKWRWNVESSAAKHQEVFRRDTQLPGVTLNGYRPAFVSVDQHHGYASIFQDDHVGAWSAIHDQDRAAFDRYTASEEREGRRPIRISCGGSYLGGIRYAGVFAETDVPEDRRAVVRGSGDARLAGIDSIIQTFMAKYGVRAGQLAIAKGKTIVYDRAYTWAEPSYRTVEPSDLFLLASVSKVFVRVAVADLIARGALSKGTGAYPTIGLTSRPATDWEDDITVDHLLMHESGYDLKPDVTYDMRAIARALNPGAPTRVTRSDVCRYVYEKLGMARHPNDRKGQYCNYGYLLLTAVVDSVTGSDYWTYLRNVVLQPRGITEVAPMPTLAQDRWPELAIMEDFGSGGDAWDPAAAPQPPWVYGGNGMVNEEAIGSCGLAASARSVALLMADPAATGQSGWSHGSATMAEQMAEGYQWCLSFNTRNMNEAERGAVDEEIRKVIRAVKP